MNKGDSIIARALTGQRTWAESQMYLTGKGARREFETYEAAMFTYHSHLRSRTLLKAFRAGWEMGEEP